MTDMEMSKMTADEIRAEIATLPVRSVPKVRTMRPRLILSPSAPIFGWGQA